MGKVEAKERSGLQHNVGLLLWLPIVVSTIFILLVLRSSNPSSIVIKETLAQEPSNQLCSATPTNPITVNDSPDEAALTVVDNGSLSQPATTVQGSDPNASIAANGSLSEPATTVQGSDPNTSIAANDSLSQPATTVQGSDPNTSIAANDSLSQPAKTVQVSDTSIAANGSLSEPAKTVQVSDPNTSIAANDSLSQPARTVQGSDPNTSIAANDSLSQPAKTVQVSDTSIAANDSLSEPATTVQGSHPNTSIAANGSPNETATTVQVSHPNTSSPVLLDGVAEEVCDMTKGRWVRDPQGSIYTNVTCKVLPDIDNCQKYDKSPEYQYWRWQPDGCDLPRFDPAAFLDFFRGKTMAFVGDSLARNNMESLLCLLSMAEAPVELSEEPSVRILRWHFPSRNFTLMELWTEYFVDAVEKVDNGTLTGLFDINMDKMNPRWADKLPGLDYVILSGGNWQFRKNRVHEGGRAIGCVGCTEDGLPDLDAKSSIRKVVRAALEYISECKECAGLTTLLRSFTSSHFEGGGWADGHCNKTAPLDERQIDLATERAWEIRKIQLEELARIRKRLRKKPAASPDMKFGFLDVTRPMMMRADAHPGTHGRVTDCLHWCLPGPIDMWSQVLFATLSSKFGLF